MSAKVWVVAAMTVLVGCRDEQAGPKRRNQPAAQQQQGGAPPAALGQMPTELSNRSGVSWGGGAFAYLGSKVEPANPNVGQPVTLRHFFKVLKTPPEGYNLFMHLVDTDTLRMITNLDHPIQNGAAPMSSWQPGMLVEDVHQIQMPAYQGSLGIMLGFWNEGAGRLQPDQPQASDGDGRVFGPRLSAPKQPPLPEYHMPKAAKAPKIDGLLNDDAWKLAPEVTLTTSYDGKDTRLKTRMRLTWDEKNIYVAFDCDDPDAWGSMRKKDDPIYNEEVVEVFFDADGDGATYNELQVSPHNVNFDASFVARRSDLEAAKKWESGMLSAVNVRGTLDNDSDKDQGWSAEMQIPIANLNQVPHVPPQKGDKWRFNGYRLEHFVHGRDIEGQSFSPLFVGDFHALPRFGWLVFEAP